MFKVKHNGDSMDRWLLFRVDVSSFFSEHLRAPVLHHSLETLAVQAEFNSWLVLVVSYVS